MVSAQRGMSVAGSFHRVDLASEGQPLLKRKKKKKKSDLHILAYQVLRVFSQAGLLDDLGLYYIYSICFLLDLHHV
jgi:hypothetical protein